MAKLFITLLDWLFPRTCLSCGKGGAYLCTDCLPRIERASDIDLPDCYAIFSYREPSVKKAVQMLKYRGVHSLARELGELIYDHLIEELAIDSPENERIVVIPVPITRERRRERGYNQSEKLAATFVARDPQNFALVCNCLQKVKATASQVSLKNREKRLANLQGSFIVAAPDIVRGQLVVVIDDVITTGATMQEARRSLKAAGARKVIGLAVAHG